MVTKIIACTISAGSDFYNAYYNVNLYSFELIFSQVVAIDIFENREEFRLENEELIDFFISNENRKFLCNLILF